MRRKVHLNQNYIFCLIRINLYGALDSGVCSPKKHNLNILRILKKFSEKNVKKNVNKHLKRQDMYICITIISLTTISNTVAKIIFGVLCRWHAHLNNVFE